MEEELGLVDRVTSLRALLEPFDRGLLGGSDFLLVATIVAQGFWPR